MGMSTGGAPGNRSGGGRGYRRQQFSEINVTPFVDVMLVLLVIFMVTAPLITAGVAVDLPESSARPVEGQDEPLTVTITADQAIYIQETEVELANLGAKLNAIVGEKRDTRIFVRGDKEVSYGEVMRVMGEINAAGLRRVALLSEALQ